MAPRLNSMSPCRTRFHASPADSRAIPTSRFCIFSQTPSMAEPSVVTCKAPPLIGATGRCNRRVQRSHPLTADRAHARRSASSQYRCPVPGRRRCVPPVCLRPRSLPRHARTLRDPGYAQTTASLFANQLSTDASKRASIPERLIFKVGVKQPFSIVQGSLDTTIMCSRS